MFLLPLQKSPPPRPTENFAPLQSSSSFEFQFRGLYSNTSARPAWSNTAAPFLRSSFLPCPKTPAPNSPFPSFRKNSFFKLSRRRVEEGAIPVVAATSYNRRMRAGEEEAGRMMGRARKKAFLSRCFLPFQSRHWGRGKDRG